MPDYTDIIAELRRHIDTLAPRGFGSFSASIETWTALFEHLDQLAAELADMRANYDDAMADLAGLVEVAAAAVSDETAHDPGVEVLMRYLAANYPERADD